MGGGIFGSPSADLNGATGLEIFALGGGYAPYYNAQATAGGAWSGWISLGGAITGAPQSAEFRRPPGDIWPGRRHLSQLAIVTGRCMVRLDALDTSE